MLSITLQHVLFEDIPPDVPCDISVLLNTEFCSGSTVVGARYVAAEVAMGWIFLSDKCLASRISNS
jgi:hypothetical protein